MGQCCLIFSKNNHSEKKNVAELKEVTLLDKKALVCQQYTKHDEHFTYFIGVFQLLSLGEKLELPEFTDELHPNFSYDQFNKIYKHYQEVIKKLGQYVNFNKDKQSSLNKRITADVLKLKEVQSKKISNKVPSQACLIKLQLQNVKVTGVSEIGILVKSPLNWENKFQKWTRKELIQSGPVFFQFTVPEIDNCFIRIQTRPSKGFIEFDVKKAFETNQQVICKNVSFQNGGAEEAVAIRMQLYRDDPEDYQQKIQQMSELHQRLIQGYGLESKDLGNSDERDQIEERLSKHRSSLHKKYNLNNDKL